MSNMHDNYLAFLGAVVPDVDQELDRICMALIEVDLQQLRSHAVTINEYDAKVAEFKESLYGAPTEDSKDDVNPLYPAQHLSYWVAVRAEYWKRNAAPTGAEETE